MASHEECMEQAIKLAQQSHPEDGKVHPLVGALAVKDGAILSTAFRGEQPGDHAEFTLLERKIEAVLASGCTVYTTLEPCTSRNHPKIPCASRLIENRVRKVVIGMLDPNPIITGRGILALNSAGIETELFPKEFADKVIQINREFIRLHSEAEPSSIITNEFVEENQGRSLDDMVCDRQSNLLESPVSFHIHGGLCPSR